PHVSSGVRSAGCNLIATLVFGMSETIAITGKSVKLFKGHYTSLRKGELGAACAFSSVSLCPGRL
ncbi:MAG: hypothetical protein ACREYE_16440, partial [Gammaproteobacteria bacterium]